MKLNEAINKEHVSIFEKIIDDINNDKKLFKYIEAARQEVFNYNRHYGIIIILKKMNDEKLKKIVKYIKEKYAKDYEIKRNKSILKILIKKEKDEI